MLREISEEEGDAEFKQRTARLAKWREVAKAAVPEDLPSVEIPDSLTPHGFDVAFVDVIFVGFFPCALY